MIALLTPNPRTSARGEHDIHHRHQAEIGHFEQARQDGELDELRQDAHARGGAVQRAPEVALLRRSLMSMLCVTIYES